MTYAAEVLIREKARLHGMLTADPSVLTRTYLTSRIYQLEKAIDLLLQPVDKDSLPKGCLSGE